MSDPRKDQKSRVMPQSALFTDNNRCLVWGPDEQRAHIQMSDKVKKKNLEDVRCWATTNTDSVHFGTDSASVWNCIKGMNTILPRDIPLISVLMVVEVVVESIV